MTKDELFKIWNEMRKQKVDEGLPPPYEPSPMDFAMKVAEISYEEGYDDGCFQATGGQ